MESSAFFCFKNPVPVQCFFVFLAQSSFFWPSRFCFVFFGPVEFLFCFFVFVQSSRVWRKNGLQASSHQASVWQSDAAGKQVHLQYFHGNESQAGRIVTVTKTSVNCDGIEYYSMSSLMMIVMMILLLIMMKVMMLLTMTIVWLRALPVSIVAPSAHQVTRKAEEHHWQEAGIGFNSFKSLHFYSKDKSCSLDLKV